MVKEARVVCGKARTCKLSGGKVIDVYDEDKKVYVPYEEFLRQQEEYKTNPIVDDTLDIEKKKDDKKEYFTTHGKKTKEVKEDKKEKEDKKSEVQNLPSNIVTTSNGNMLSAGYTISADVTVDDSKVDSDRVKITNKKKDPYDWYIKNILKY